MRGLAGKTALVTGGSRGIGRDVALRLAAEGVAVAVNFNTGEAEAAEVVKEAEALGTNAIALKGSVASAADADSLVGETLAKLGGLDILVNNAGITRDNLLMRMSEEDWDAVLDTNLKGAFLCTKAAIRPMLRQRSGRIINMSSVVALTGNAGQANYTAAKAGLIGFTKTVAGDHGERDRAGVHRDAYGGGVGGGASREDPRAHPAGALRCGGRGGGGGGVPGERGRGVHHRAGAERGRRARTLGSY
jgi:3-oxoacyl-[acyl-carrier protein] reductase